MKSTPRFTYQSLICFISLLAFFWSVEQQALAQSAQRQEQQRGGRPSRPQQQPTQATDNKEAERARRDEAITLLRNTAERARAFHDLFYRARVQALAADALWAYDEEHARLIFRRAWEAATASDKAEQEEQESAAGAVAGSEGATIAEARDEVLLKVASRDQRLAELFLKELLSAERGSEQSAPQSQPARLTPWHELGAADQQRLAFAYDLLGRNDSNSAAQMAAPLANRLTSADLIAFIIRLRERNPAAAERLYSSVLAQARTRLDEDANSVLLLSAPVIAPELLMVVDPNGSLQFRPLARTQAMGGAESSTPPLSQTLRNSFFAVAAELLLRPATPRADTSRTQQVVALYLATGRLLPFFEREATQYAAELRARHTALAGELDETRREMLASRLELQRITPERAGDPLRAPFDELAHANDPTERDRILLGIVRTATRNRLWERARSSAAKIDSAASRRVAQVFIAVSQISDLANTYSDEKEGGYEDVVEFLRGADVPPLARAWGYAEAALIASRRKESRGVVTELLNEAEQYAGRVEVGTRQRVAAYCVVARSAARLDTPRAWALLAEAVKAANSSREPLAGDSLSLDILADENSTPEAADFFSVTAEAFRLDGIFATMSQIDWTKTLADARSLEGDVPQALALIAMSRAALEHKQGGARG